MSTPAILAEGLGKIWKQTVIVENRPGAGTATGTAAVARSTPDGYTMLVTTGAFGILPAVRSDLTYDTLVICVGSPTTPASLLSLSLARIFRPIICGSSSIWPNSARTAPRVTPVRGQAHSAT